VSAEKAAWQAVLDAEAQRWSAMPVDELVRRLREAAVHEIELRAKKYQVEVELLRETGTQLEIMIAVDDGVLPRSLRPLTQIIARAKPAAG
jgi:hypothetical protein